MIATTRNFWMLRMWYIRVVGRWRRYIYGVIVEAGEKRDGVRSSGGNWWSIGGRFCFKAFAGIHPPQLMAQKGDHFGLSCVAVSLSPQTWPKNNTRCVLAQYRLGESCQRFWVAFAAGLGSWEWLLWRVFPIPPKGRKPGGMPSFDHFPDLNDAQSTVSIYMTHNRGACTAVRTW